MEVSYDGNTFKITITTDYDLRIKVPKFFQDSPEEILWINTCKIILTQMKENKFISEYTLRGKSDVNEFGYFYSFNLQSMHTHSGKKKISEYKCRIFENIIHVEKYKIGEN